TRSPGATRRWRPRTRRCTSTAWRSGCAGRWAEPRTTGRPPPASRGGGLPANQQGAGAGSLVEQRPDLVAVDVALVVPVEAGVDDRRQRLAVDGLHRRVDERPAHADRVLGDRAEHLPVADRLDLAGAGVEPDDRKALGPALLHTADDADRRALVRTVDALGVRVRGDDRLGDVGRLRLVAAAVLGLEHLDAGRVGLHPLDEPVAAVGAGLA